MVEQEVEFMVGQVIFKTLRQGMSCIRQLVSAEQMIFAHFLIFFNKKKHKPLNFKLNSAKFINVIFCSIITVSLSDIFEELVEIYES